MMASSMSAGFTPARSTAALTATAPKSLADSDAKSPWKPPIGVLAAPTMTIGSFSMVRSFRFARSSRPRQREIDDVRARRGFHVIGKCGRAAYDRVEMDGGIDHDRRHLTSRRISHLVDEAQHAVADLERSGTHRDDVPRDQLALIGDPLLDRGHAACVVAQERRR